MGKGEKEARIAQGDPCYVPRVRITQHVSSDVLVHVHNTCEGVGISSNVGFALAANQSLLLVPANEHLRHQRIAPDTTMLRDAGTMGGLPRYAGGRGLRPRSCIWQAGAAANPAGLQPMQVVQPMAGRAQGQMEDYETPMTPATAMRNALGREEGGSGVPLDRAAYQRAVAYWDAHALISSGTTPG